MTGRVLIVDDLIPNIKLLQAKLTSEYYDVICATSGLEAIELAIKKHPDIILLDVMMPGMDGFKTCKNLKLNPLTTHIPIVMVTALDDTPENKVNGLKAGADDFLTKPINDIALFARIRSLTRLKMIIDELRLRGKTNSEVSLLENEVMNYINKVSTAKILIIDEDKINSSQIFDVLKKYFEEIIICNNPKQAFDIGITGDYDLIVINTQTKNIDSLRICSQFRSKIETRYTPILIFLEEDNNINLLIKAFEIGINDYVMVPIDNNELIARVNIQIRRKRYQDALRINLDNNITMSITDPLTGSYNRRYFEKYFKNIVKESLEKGRSLSLMMIDIDYFKKVNDQYGHIAGDKLLKEIKLVIAENIRIMDLLARLGGEEFVVILPDVEINEARIIGERVRKKIEDYEFKISEEMSINKTISIGITSIIPYEDNVQNFLDRADKCLYQAKKSGRNKVIADV